MIQAKCIQKLRDKHNNIKSYILEDANGQRITVSAEQLKMAIFTKQIDIINLKLTQDGKLIDKTPTTSQAPQAPAYTTRLSPIDKFCQQMTKLKEMKDPDSLIEGDVEYVLDCINKTFNTKFKRCLDPDSFIYNNAVIILTPGEDCIHDIEFACLCLSYGKDGNIYIGKLRESLKDIVGKRDVDKIKEELADFLKYIQKYGTTNKDKITFEDVIISAYEITSKFTDTKYATVGRYIINSEPEYLGQGRIEFCIKFKGIISPKGDRGNYLEADVDLLRIELSLLDNEKYRIDIEYCTKIEDSGCRNNHKKLITHCYGGFTSTKIMIDADNKNYKRDIKLFLEQYFKIAYSNFRNAIDTKKY